MTHAEQVFKKVVTLFSFFEYPVTAFEVSTWQQGTYRCETLVRAFKSSSELQGEISCFNGFYGQGSKADVRKQVMERHRRYRNALRKYRKLSWFLWFAKRVPWVEGIAICNTLAFHNTKQKSDIDLFVLTKPGAVWKSRLVLVLPLLFLRQRPGETKDSAIDTNFFLSTDDLDLSSLRKGDDPYLALWIASLSPAFERTQGIFDKLFKANAWVHAFFPERYAVHRAESFKAHPAHSFPLVLSERFAKWIQVNKFPQDIRQGLEDRSTDIVATDRMLKFHKNDRREAFATFLHERLTL